MSVARCSASSCAGEDVGEVPVLVGRGLPGESDGIGGIVRERAVVGIAIARPQRHQLVGGRAGAPGVALERESGGTSPWDRPRSGQVVVAVRARFGAPSSDPSSPRTRRAGRASRCSRPRTAARCPAARRRSRARDLRISSPARRSPRGRSNRPTVPHSRSMTRCASRPPASKPGPAIGSAKRRDQPATAARRGGRERDARRRSAAPRARARRARAHRSSPTGTIETCVPRAPANRRCAR